MNVRGVQNWLFPGSGADEGFHQECLSLSYSGARVAGALGIGVGLTGFTGLLPWPAAAGIGILGGLTLLARRADSLFEHSRTLVALGTGLGAVLAALTLTPGPGGGFAQAAIALLLVAAPAVAPLWPWQSLLMGAGVAAAGAVSGHAGALAILAVSSTALSAALYQQRLRNYRSLAGLLRASQEFRDWQSRMVRSESAATMVQLSAALAHELSSPIGTVSSSVDTLLLLAARQAQAADGERERLTALQADLGRSLKESLARLKKIVNRIQRLCNLDDAAAQRANVNELLREAAALAGAQVPGSVEFQWNLGPLPELQCRPQQLLTVFWNVLLNAAQAGDGGGRVSIGSRVEDARVEVVIEDHGRGIAPERLAHIFDPVFHVAEGRVSTGNWSLFTARQLIKNHDGELRIKSLTGQGTTVTIYLPCSS